MNLTARQKAFFLIVLKQRLKNAAPLFAFVSESEKREMTKMYAALSGRGEREISAVATSELRQLASSKKQNYLADVHVDWLVDKLCEETPEIIAAILRQLPAERVRAVLNTLPHEVLDFMPKLSDTYAIPEQLVDLFQKKFESFFPLSKQFDPEKRFEYEHLCLLRADHVAKVFLNLGYREVALGLITLPDTARGVVLNRLAPNDRERVQHYLKTEKNQVAERRLKRAQVHLVSKEVQAGDPSVFVRSMGFMVFAKTVLRRDLDDIIVIKHKLSRKDCKILDYFIENHIDKNTEASVVGFREDLLIAVRNVYGKEIKNY
ncbi:MAG: hypothetical protein ABII18_06955 [bacterium]